MLTLQRTNCNRDTVSDSGHDIPHVILDLNFQEDTLVQRVFVDSRVYFSLPCLRASSSPSPPTSSECLIYISAPQDFHLAHTSACSYCFSTLPFLTRLPSPSFAKLSLRFSTRRPRPSFLSHCIFFAGLRAHALFRRHFLLRRHSSSFLSFPPYFSPASRRISPSPSFPLPLLHSSSSPFLVTSK